MKNKIFLMALVSKFTFLPLELKFPLSSHFGAQLAINILLSLMLTVSIAAECYVSLLHHRESEILLIAVVFGAFQRPCMNSLICGSVAAASCPWINFSLDAC